jgi:gluconolactonase
MRKLFLSSRSSWAALACAAAAWLTAVPAAADDVVAPLTTPSIAGVVAVNTKIEFIKEGFSGTEGPLGLPDGSLLFTETQANRITRIAPDGSTAAWLEDSNGANGLALGPHGEVYAVQVLQPRVGIIHPPERRKLLADRADGLPFGRPNDLVLDQLGNVYFTDSGANAQQQQARPADAPPTAKPAVYRISARGELQRLADDIQRPNGIQLSPDEKVLYVANTAGEHVLAYDIGADGRVGPRRNFAKLAGFRTTETGATSSGADGLAVDARGRLYVASTAGIQVFSPSGEALGIIALPRPPQNLAFAGPGKRTLYAVGRGAAWRIAVLTPGYAGRAK